MKHWIGIDVSKATLDFALRDKEGELLEHMCVANERRAVVGLVGRWKKLFGLDMAHCLLCLEHTGHYSRMVLELVVKKGWAAWVANPLDIQQSLGMQRGKRDKVDAQRIAEYARLFHRKARLFHASHLKLERLKQLLARREFLVRDRGRNKAHVTDLNRYADIKLQAEFDRMDQQAKRLLDKQILRVDELIAAEVRSTSELQEQYRLLRSIPGVGEQLACHLLAVTDGFLRYNEPKALACHAGCAPFEYSSGSSVRGRNRVSHRANKRLKCLLHMGAMRAVRMAGELRDYYLRKVAEGKKPILVLNAVRNKLIHRVCAVIRRNEPYTTTHLHVS